MSWHIYCPFSPLEEPAFNNKIYVSLLALFLHSQLRSRLSEQLHNTFLSLLRGHGLVCSWEVIFISFSELQVIIIFNGDSNALSKAA